MKYTLETMLNKLIKSGKSGSLSEAFLISEFGEDGFNTLKHLGCISSCISFGAERYVKELEFISKENLAEFRARIKAETDNSDMLTSGSEKAEFLPAAYYPEGQSCISGFILKMNEGDKLEQESVYLTTSSPKFDNVLGFRIDNDLIVSRYSSFGYYPANHHLLARRFGGRIPTEAEFLKIAGKLADVNASMRAIDEDYLLKGYYLVAPEPLRLSAVDEGDDDCYPVWRFLKTASVIYKLKIPKQCLSEADKQEKDFLVINIENPDDRKIIQADEKCVSLVVV